MKRTLACIFVALVVAASGSACTATGSPEAGGAGQATATHIPCTTTVNSLTSAIRGMLTVDLWPDSPAVGAGYQTITFDDAACGHSAIGSDPLCTTFPWLAYPDSGADSALATLGVHSVISAMIQGGRPVPQGTPFVGQEIREKVFVFGGSASATQNLITRFAAACARPVTLPGPTTYPGVVAFQSSARGQDGGNGTVAAMFAAVGNKIFWLEFDSDNVNGGWTEADYLRITGAAIALADQL